MLSPDQIFARMTERQIPDELQGLNLVVQFHLDGPEGGARYVGVQGGALEVSPGVHPKPTMSLHLTSADFVALAAGELRSQLAFLTRRIKIAGDVGLAATMLKVLGLTQD